jgi:hypothetical protein
LGKETLEISNPFKQKLSSSGTCRQTNPYWGEDNWGKFRILLNINSEKTCSEKNAEFFSLKKIQSKLFRVFFRVFLQIMVENHHRNRFSRKKFRVFSEFFL